MSTAIQRFYEFVANSTLAPQVTEYLPDNKDNRIWTKNLRQGVLITTCAIFLVSSVPSLLFGQGTRRITEHKSIADLNYPKPHCDGKFQCQAVSGTNGNLEWQTHCPERILESGHIKLRRGRSIDLLDEPYSRELADTPDRSVFGHDGRTHRRLFLQYPRCRFRSFHCHA
jgi:hypothetical protein